VASAEEGAVLRFRPRKVATQRGTRWWVEILME
jgi:hypothetical protein